MIEEKHNSRNVFFRVFLFPDGGSLSRAASDDLEARECEEERGEGERNPVLPAFPPWLFADDAAHINFRVYLNSRLSSWSHCRLLEQSAAETQQDKGEKVGPERGEVPDPSNSTQSNSLLNRREEREREREGRRRERLWCLSGLNFKRILSFKVPQCSRFSDERRSLVFCPAPSVRPSGEHQHYHLYFQGN